MGDGAARASSCKDVVGTWQCTFSRIGICSPAVPKKTKSHPGLHLQSDHTYSPTQTPTETRDAASSSTETHTMDPCLAKRLGGGRTELSEQEPAIVVPGVWRASVVPFAT